ncbi:hypothetical protein [Streptomyces sp. NBC_00878]|uniref:hypothetical protein n=1 Tax=Streptomyces sp. NBC_00878 TaxID=2975854 RepID=UPI002251096E|nr:hypothetical protein [Streptomyces sp. NBC_00878]MCX4910774.1 hypothetical protein [Streptomyces sp. NBC_00878]
MSGEGRTVFGSGWITGLAAAKAKGIGSEDQDPAHSRADRPADGGYRQYSCWSTTVRRMGHHETKNLLVSYSAKKLGFF